MQNINIYSKQILWWKDPFFIEVHWNNFGDGAMVGFISILNFMQNVLIEILQIFTIIKKNQFASITNYSKCGDM